MGFIIPDTIEYGNEQSAIASIANNSLVRSTVVDESDGEGGER
jgi:hypothetical protein